MIAFTLRIYYGCFVLRWNIEAGVGKWYLAIIYVVVYMCGFPALACQNKRPFIDKNLIAHKWRSSDQNVISLRNMGYSDMDITPSGCQWFCFLYKRCTAHTYTQHTYTQHQVMCTGRKLWHKTHIIGNGASTKTRSQQFTPYKNLTIHAKKRGTVKG